MKIIQSIPFIDFSLGSNIGTVEEVRQSMAAAKTDIHSKLNQLLTPAQIAKTAWSEKREGNKKVIVVQLPESQEETYSVFASQFEKNN